MPQILIAGFLASLVLSGGDVTFEEAKADASKRAAWLESLLGRHLHDKDKNPQAMLHAWYYVVDEKQKSAAQEMLKAQYQAEKREFYFAREIQGIFALLESPAHRVVVWYRDSALAGSNSKAAILLVGDVFALAGEDEAKSVIEDYALAYVNLREAGLTVKGLELDASIPALKNVSNKSLLPVWSQAGQLVAVLTGARKVSDGFRQELIKQYLATHQLWSKQFAHEKKIYDDNNENALQKEIVDFLDVCFKTNHERILAAGYVHKLVSKETHEYALEKK